MPLTVIEISKIILFIYHFNKPQPTVSAKVFTDVRHVTQLQQQSRHVDTNIQESICMKWK